MIVHKIPEQSHIGQYNLILENINEKDKETIIKLKRDMTTRQIFANKKEPSNDPNITFIPSKQLQDIEKGVHIPSWIRNKTNFKHLLNKDYDKIKPITTEFVTTLNCNYRCEQCAYKEPKKELDVWLEKNSGKKFKANKNPKTHMSHEVMKVCIDRLIEGGVQNILFTGGGEPLMNPVTIEGMEYAKKKGAVVALYTNGRLLSTNLIKRIVKTDPLFVRISVYGGNQETSQEYTRAFSDHKLFQTVMNNINYLAEEKKSSGSQMHIGISYLVHPITSGSVKEFAKNLKKLKNVDEINYVRFTPAVDYFHKKQHSQDFMEEIFGFIEKEVKPMFEGKPTKILLYHHRLKDLNRKKSYAKCRASGWFGEVGPSGEMYLCCEKHFMPEYKIGDLKVQSLDEIWEGTDRKNVISRVNKTACENCPTLCKPHELNKIFHELEESMNAGKTELINTWAEDLLQHGKDYGYKPGRLDDFQS
jgi:MoaA/NifB/PqqE/SkfB family radical SAM enzyme